MARRAKREHLLSDVWVDRLGRVWVKEISGGVTKCIFSLDELSIK